jgi:hypothetical protein
MSVIGRSQHLLAFGKHGLGATEVHLRRREAHETAVVVLVVVPGEEAPAVAVGEHRVPRRIGEDRGGVIGAVHRSPVKIWAAERRVA